jgi:hypothetical protein
MTIVSTANGGRPLVAPFLKADAPRGRGNGPGTATRQGREDASSCNLPTYRAEEQGGGFSLVVNE